MTAALIVLLTSSPAMQDARPGAPPPEYRQFDFWIGQWEVRSKDGRLLGTNTISKSDNGFVLTEKWKSARGGTGTSINYYDPRDAAWKQVWVDVAGGIIRYSGKFADGRMNFEGDFFARNGSQGIAKATFTPLPDGRVHQHIEHSEDDGKTWKIYFDGYYKKQ